MDKHDTVAVIGAGKMGLPLACSLASGGAQVIACDVNVASVKTINQGRCPFKEPGLDKVLKDVVKRGTLVATTETTQAVEKSDVIIVIVPVLLNDDSDANLSAIQSVSADIARGLKRGAMVSYETTLPVGTTRKLIPILESSGLKAGRDFDLVFSPERVKSQTVLEKLSQTPKVVGGITGKAAQRAAKFYQRYLRCPVINVNTLEAAELVKLAGMVYRDVNIALANELARYASQVGVDIQSVISAANTDGEAAILSPGVGVGGHCTPIYPHFLINDAERRGMSITLATESRNINDSQPSFAIQELEQRYGKLDGRDVLILGLAFRPQVKEYIKSPAFLLREALRKVGANVLLCDPLYSNREIMDAGFKAFDINERVLPEVIILNTAHNQFLELNFKSMHKRGLRVVFDGRNAWDSLTVEDAEVMYIGVGKHSARLDGSDDQDDPTAAAYIPIARPQLGTPEVKAVSGVIRSHWLMMGPEVAAFEKEFAQYTGAPHATAVSSGTTALHLALLAVGVKPGDEVITVSHSFIATANSIRYCGAVPVFIDVEKATFNMDARLIEAAITDKTKAILCVHQMGMPCDLSAIIDIAKRHQLPVVEDAACAAGSEILWQDGWEKIGKPHADVACFSLHPRKLLTTGDGGMLTTASLEMDRLFKSLRNHGLEDGRHKWLGYNYRMTDLQAAVGRRQLERLPGLIEQRHHLADLYKQKLSPVSAVKLPLEPEWARSNWQSYCVRFDNKRTRDRIMKELESKGIDTRCGITCAHREEAYKNEDWRITAGTARVALKISEDSQDNCLILPMPADMTEEQLARVAQIIQNALVKVRA